MTLTPKAKPIRIRIVSGGEEHSSIETLRDNYSLDDILPRVKDGQLYKWLKRVGEIKAAETAEKLKDHDIDANSKSMVELTSVIFNTTSTNIEELLELWHRKYPKSFLNNIKNNIPALKSYCENLQNISEARELYSSCNDENSKMALKDWQNIFVTILKKLPLKAVLDDFKKHKSDKPMNVMSWLKVLTHYTNSVSDEELYFIAEAAYEYPYLKDEAVEWYQKSAKTYGMAKEWVDKNVKSTPNTTKRALTPQEIELFKSFQKGPTKFSELYFDTSYPQDLVRFLNTLSSIYRTTLQPYTEQITGRGEYTKYLLIIKELYHMGKWGGYTNCINQLKQLSQKYPYEFQGYKNLDRIISSLENKEPIFDKKLWELNYQQLIRFIAALAKGELGYEK